MVFSLVRIYLRVVTVSFMRCYRLFQSAIHEAQTRCSDGRDGFSLRNRRTLYVGHHRTRGHGSGPAVVNVAPDSRQSELQIQVEEEVVEGLCKIGCTTKLCRVWMTLNLTAYRACRSAVVPDVQ